MRGFIKKKKILQETFCHANQYLFIPRACRRVGGHSQFSLPAFDEGEKRVMLSTLAAYLSLLPSRLPFLSFLFFFLLTGTSSLSHFLRFERVLSRGPTAAGCSFGCFVLFLHKETTHT